MNKYILFFLLYIHPTPLKTNAFDMFIIWNVGQGAWLTLLKDPICYHFDMGGEKAPWTAVKTLCQNRLNAISISHWDKDHMNFARNAPYYFPYICILNAPSVPAPNFYKSQILKIPSCAITKFPGKLLFRGHTDSPQPNRQSQVFLIENKILFPGDAPPSWLKNSIQNIKLLVLSHHGGTSGTSSKFLKLLPNLKIAIASARKEVYGHPNQKVVAWLRDNNVALLETQDWGHIAFYLQSID